MRRICIVTAGHLATCPRMLKAADALVEAGYCVRVVSAQWMAWATAADAEVGGRRGWRWTSVKYGRSAGLLSWTWSGARRHAAWWAVLCVPPARLPLSVTARAWLRAHPALLRAAVREPADVYYGGGGALPTVFMAARRRGVPYAIDLEDLHSGEAAAIGHGTRANVLAESLERRVLSRAAFATAGSAAIAEAYRTKYGVAARAIHNTFPLPAIVPSLANSAAGPLALYWFSQTIGPGRGLEDVVTAVGLAQIECHLHLRGRPAPGYLEGLRRLAREQAPRLRLWQHEPAGPDRMVDLCRGHHAGLAVEPGASANNDLALSNKALTYPLAGLAVVLTHTTGQRMLAGDLGDGALLYRPGDVRTLAAGLRQWAHDRTALTRARTAAWAAAQRRWHWGHEDDRGTLLRLIDEVFDPGQQRSA